MYSKYETHTHYHDTMGCLPIVLIFIAVGVIFGLSEFTESIENFNEEREKTERAKEFFSAMIEVEEIRADKDKYISDNEVSIAKLKYWPGTVKHIFNIFVVFVVVMFLSILFISLRKGYQ